LRRAFAVAPFHGGRSSVHRQHVAARRASASAKAAVVANAIQGRAPRAPSALDAAWLSA
jgi:hypothetical protein